MSVIKKIFGAIKYYYKLYSYIKDNDVYIVVQKLNNQDNSE